jgi:SnoaL-like polyketide cyclase/Divalent cation transporter
VRLHTDQEYADTHARASRVAPECSQRAPPRHHRPAERFPDFQFSILDQLAEGDRIAIRFRGLGTHRAEFLEFLGVPASGRRIDYTGLPVLPLVLWRFDMDPAVVSAPLLTTIVDRTELIIHFSTPRCA